MDLVSFCTQLVY